jgi:hypothetical protein
VVGGDIVKEKIKRLAFSRRLNSLGELMPDVVEINVETGEVVERKYTKTELAQLKAERIASEKLALELKAEYDEEVAKRQAIVEKFLAIGLTEEEAEKMVPPVQPDYRILHLL